MIKNYYKLIVALLFVTNVFGQNLPSYLPKDGLVGWWPFNGNTNDESGYGRHLNNTTAVLETDRHGNKNNGYSLANGGRLSYFGKSITGGEAFTYSFWMKTNKNLNEYPDGIFSESGVNESGHETGIWFFFEPNTKDFGIVNPGISYAGILRKNFPYIDEWHHVVVQGPVDYKIFVDGELFTTGTSNYKKFADSCLFHIGGFQGSVDDFSIHNRILTSDEIQTLYKNSVPKIELPSYLPSKGLVAWWPFNGNANDESGNGNHGTVNGATLTNDRNGKNNSSYNFDGKSNFIEIAHSNTLNLSSNGMSFNLWMKVPEFPSDDKEHYFLSKHSGIGSSMNGIHATLSNYMNSNSLFYRYKTENKEWGGNGFLNNLLKTDNWFQLTIVVDSTYDYIYLNGELLSRKTKQDDVKYGENNESLYFGKDINIFNSSTDGLYLGTLDDISIYNRALTEAEIQALYTGTPLCKTPPTPKVNPTVTTCADNSISIEATGATSVETYNWYDVAEGGTPIATSQIFKTPVLNYGENKTYWVSITNSVCESTRARVDVVVKELPMVKNPENISVCSGEFIQTINFAVSPQGATNYWSNDNTAIGLPTNGVGEIPGFKTPSNINSPILSNITVTPSFNGCVGKSETFKIYVIPTPKVAITNLKPIVYTSDAPIALEGEPAGGTFTGEAIVGTIFTPAKATLGKKSVEYKYVSKDGCGGIATASTIVVDTNGVVCTKYDTITVKETIYDTVLKITFKLTTGINISKTTSLSVYPNPTADNLIIDAADVAAMSGYSYQLLDAVGKEIYSQLVTSKKTEISLKTLGAKGVYVLHVLDANNQSVVSKKIVLE